MVKHLAASAFSATAMVLMLASAHAQTGSGDAAQLGKSLTPVGAVAAANTAGTIPAWNGGLTKPPTDFKPGGHYPDPYADDRPLFTITADNVDQYREHLTPGQVAMLKKYPTYKIVVYPTHRSASFPKTFYDDTLYAASHAKLAPGGNSVLNTTSGVPFPIPHDGQEAIWNHLLRYRGDTYGTTWTEAPVLRNGDYTPARQTFEYDFSYANLAKPLAAREPNRMMNFFELLLSPPRLAGTLLLIYEPIDQVKEPRRSWIYTPGQRRVQLAPEFAYDFPAEASDGMRTYDDFNMFNGAIDRYDWKLIGKQEVYIPYNSYKITGNSIKHSDLIRPGHLNSEYGRYELHRVWVVEAQLKPGVRHIYAKRVFYLDEDSWAAVLIDKYDAQGQLWRVAEAHSINLYNIPMYYQTVEAHYDLQSGRYDVMGLRNEEPRVYEPLKRSAADFTPFRLRELGTR